MRKLKTPEEIIDDYESDNELWIHHRKQLKEMIKAAQRDALECVAERAEATL